jgi:radical SAM protein with 4Fe4S-binding SPASM domain
MAYFNISSVMCDDTVSVDKRKISRVVEDIRSEKWITPLLLDNEFKVIGNHEVYEACKEMGIKAIYGQRITNYTKDRGYPDRFSVEITNRCNYKCIMCPRTQMTRPETDMDELLFKKIIDDISENGASMIDLYRLGESTIHPKFGEYLSYVDEKIPHLNTSLFSNAGSLDIKKLKRIMESTLTLFSVSVNALDRDTYGVITGGGKYDNMRKVVETAKSLKKGRKPFFGVQYLEQELNRDKHREFIDSYIDYVDYIETSMLEDFGGQLTQNEEYIRKYNYKQKAGQVNRTPCQRSIWGRFRIYSNGDVVPCICDINASYLNMGNVRESTIGTIYNSEKWQQFRDLHRGDAAKDHPLCGPCEDWMIYTDYNAKHHVVCS